MTDILRQVALALAAAGAALTLLQLGLPPTVAVALVAGAQLLILPGSLRRGLVSALIAIAAGILLLLLPDPRSAALAGLAIYALLRAWRQSRGARPRAVLITGTTALTAVAAAGWLGGWSSGGIACALWTTLLIWACGDLLHAEPRTGDRAQDAFVRRARALRATLDRST